MGNTIKGLELAISLAEAHREETSDLDHYIFTLKEMLKSERQIYSRKIEVKREGKAQRVPVMVRVRLIPSGYDMIESFRVKFYQAIGLSVTPSYLERKK